LRARGVRFALATNNASRTPEQYTAKLAGMGVAKRADEVLTSALATAECLDQRAAATGTSRRVFIIGEDGLCQALAERGFTRLGLYETGADYVVCGMDRGLSWDKLATATLNVRAGALLVGTNPDTSIPTERGISHGNGAILAALQAATGVSPLIIGKPEPIMYEQARHHLDARPEETVAIGDRLETDILGAVRAGLDSVLVLSGVTAPGDLARVDYAPTWVVPDIRAVTAALADGS
jgi:4-nitrophenyl phosphatase